MFEQHETSPEIVLDRAFSNCVTSRLLCCRQIGLHLKYGAWCKSNVPPAKLQLTEATRKYRPNNRRQNRTGYVDHDVFEGLPVRHWRRDFVTVAPPPPSQDSPASQNDVWAVELPYGMPKDSHLLPQHSQDLLRAARSGRIYKRPAPPEEEEVDADAILGDKTDKKEDDPKNTGFTARAWKLIPRHLEGLDVEYLAKRRKGIVTVTKKSASNAPPVMTKATVKRMDAAGNEYVQDIVVPQGQPVDGEVLSQRVIKEPNSATLGDGSLIPSKRKLPPPRKKSKGTGKSKKKKVEHSKASQLGGAPDSVPGMVMDHHVCLQYVFFRHMY